LPRPGRVAVASNVGRPSPKGARQVRSSSFNRYVFSVRRTRLATSLVLVLAFSLAAAPSYGDTISGVAVNSLVRAYEHFGMGPNEKAPFRLEPYVVVIEQWGTDFRITADQHSTGAHHQAVIDGETGQLVSPTQFQAFHGMILLPGVIAGEIIAAYQHVLTEHPFPQTVARLKSGSYNLTYGNAYMGGAALIFARAQAPPTMTDVRYEATPSPDPKLHCLAGACDGQFAFYIVRLRQGQVTFEAQGIL
jgi:hypothetical protein